MDFSFNIFLLVFILQILSDFCEEFDPTLKYEETKDAYIVADPICTSIVSDPLFCVMLCSKRRRCQTVNMIPNINDTFTCELFNFNFNEQQVTTEWFKGARFHVLFSSPKSFDCFAIKNSGDMLSGVYTLKHLCKKMEVYCDMETEEGGWILLQKRFDGSVDFNRVWNEYKRGFGDLNGEFWLGLDKAHELMKDELNTIRFDLWDGTEYAYAEYYNASIADESDNYRLTFEGYKGNAGDSMDFHNNQMFTTSDRDNDVRPNENCALHHTGAWWFSNCYNANLNGRYADNRHSLGIMWQTYRGLDQSLSKTEIKFKRSTTQSSFRVRK